MKKAKLLAALLCTASLTAGSIAPASVVMADAMKVVTLGADLSQAQKDTMMRYFKVDSSQVQILTITNQDEREHLSAYVPIEQIGTRTVSCAYVKPTTSGGIKVRTANLNWVTCNMIATTLSTSGVTNCEVVAACPFEVSGTGALTGIQMAYETASGEKLDETKKKIATEEMVVTGKLADKVGQNDATTVINQAKMQVIADNVQNADEIYNIVVNIADNNGVSITDDQLNTIVELLKQIAEQNYDYGEMQETLERVDENVTGEAAAPEEAADPDSIVSDLDESILGEGVLADSTEDPTLAEESGAAEAAETPSGDEVMESIEGEGSFEEDIPEELPEEEYTEEPTDVSELNTDFLGEEAKALFEKAKTFCRGEYEGDTAALQEARGAEAYCEVYLDAEMAKKLSVKVLDKYLGILGNGAGAYNPTGDEKYFTPELNMLDDALRVIFDIELTEAEEENPDKDVLGEAYSAEDKTVLYKDTMKFFEALYGETYEDYTETIDDVPEMDEPVAEGAVTPEEAIIEENLSEETIVE